MSDHESDNEPGGSSYPARLKADARGPLAWMAKNRVAANVLMIVLVVGGLVTLFFSVKQEVFPEVDLDLILINVPYPGASPEEVEQGTILAVEEAIRGVDGVKEIRSTALEGVGVVVVELLLGADADRALADVKSSVDRITSFPENAERPIISLATNRHQVISLVLYGDTNEHVLLELAEEARRDLLNDDRITFVDLLGLRPLEVSIEVPQERLREYGLTLDQVAQRIRQASIEIPGGGLKTQSGDVLLRVDERRDRAAEFADIVLLETPSGSQLRVGDIAIVEDGFAEIDQEAFFNGRRAVMVNVYRVGDETPLTVAAAVKNYVEQRRDDLPPGVGIAYWADMSELYHDRMDLLMRNARIGLVLVLLILGMFLEPKLAFWVTLGIPISFLGTMIFLPSSDVSLNMISLFAFIVTLGIVVDDAIIVGESIYHHRQQGKPFMAAAIAGVREVATPVIFSILTTCIAFAPMLFVPGVMGKFFRVVPVVVITVLLMSLLESLTVLPAHLAHPMRWYIRWPIMPFLWLMKLMQQKRVSQGLERFIQGVYQPFLGRVLKYRYLTLASCIAILVPSCALVGSGVIELAFFPKIDSDVVVASLRMPVGTPAEETREHLQAMREEAVGVLDDAGGGEEAFSRGMFTQLGQAGGIQNGPPVGADISGGHLGRVMNYLVPSAQRDFTATEFANRWRDRLGEIPGAESLTFEYSTGASAGAPIDLQLSHANTAILERAASELATSLASYAGVKDIDDGFTGGKTQFNLHLRPEARSLGLTEADLARQVRSAFFGAEAVRQQRGRHEVRVYVRSPDEERRSMQAIENFVVRTPNGGELPLWQAAEIDRGQAYTEIVRRDGRRSLNVTADIVPGEANATEVVRQLERRELPELLAKYAGLSYELSGEQQEQAETMTALGIGFFLAVMVMFGLLAIVFESWAQPLLVLSAIPFGFVGAAWGHLLMGYDVSIMSGMGVVALSGVVVNDSLILVVAVNEFRKDKMSLIDAVTSGGVRRFRPILLTSLTTFFGLVPMIVETSVQARFLIPMAIALGFGVLFATIITLVLVPALYLIFEDLRFLAKLGTSKWSAKQKPEEKAPRLSKIPAPLPGENGELVSPEELTVPLPGETKAAAE